MTCSSLDLFIESFGRHAIEGRQVVIEKDILISEDQNGFGNRIHARAVVSFLNVIMKPLNPTSCTVSPSRLAINRKMLCGRTEMDALRAALVIGVGVFVNQGSAGWRWLV